jgi:hypothetical protein
MADEGILSHAEGLELLSQRARDGSVMDRDQESAISDFHPVWHPNPGTASEALDACRAGIGPHSSWRLS